MVGMRLEPVDRLLLRHRETEETKRNTGEQEVRRKKNLRSETEESLSE